jgi:Nuclear fragile X mental retardation-interacting protein 1 (NUFIP1)
LDSHADVQAWIAERKKRFPTQKRIEEKLVAEEKLKLQREERKKTVAAQRDAQNRSRAEASAAGKKRAGRDKSPSNSNRQQELKRKKLEDLLRQANKLQAELAGSSSKSQKKPQSDEDGDGNASSDDSSGSVEEHSDHDEAPEVQSSKNPSKATTAKQKMQKSAAGRMNTNIPCKYYLRDGHCRRKDCRFLHHLPESTARKSIYEKVRLANNILTVLTRIAHGTRVSFCWSQGFTSDQRTGRYWLFRFDYKQAVINCCRWSL